MNPHRLPFFCGLLALCVQLGCSGDSKLSASNHKITSTTPASPTPSQIVPKPTPQLYPELELFDEMAKEEKNSAPIDYNGFHIIRQTKKVLLEETTKPTELSYAQILRKGKVVMTFDGVEHPLGNETRFGLFPILSPDSRQLLVQQDAWRSSQQWIVSLKSSPKILMNSGDYSLEGFGAIDLDRDGQYELVGYQKYWHYEFLKERSFSSADSPVITLVFAYNPKLQKYEPANPRYKSYLLEEIAETKNRVKSKQSYNPQALFGNMQDLMTVMITLSLVGEEKVAWELFEQHCPVIDPQEKEDVRANIKPAIRQNTVYKFLRKKRLI
jgi:hypothetical protein